MKGLLSGGAWGVVIGGLAVVTASLVAEQPAGNTPPAAPQVSAPQAAEQNVAQDFAQPAPSDQLVSDVVTDPPNEALPRVSAPETDAGSPIADTTSAALPETGGVSDALAAPEPVTAPEMVAAPEEPVLPNPQSIAPQIPAAEDDLVVSTAPAALPEPVLVEVPDAVAETLVEPDVIASGAQTAVAPDTAPETEIVTAAEQAPLTAPADLSPAVTQDDAPATGTVVDVTPELLPAPDVPEAAPEVAAADPVSEAAEPVQEPPAVVTIVAEPTTALPAGDSGVRVNRFGSDAPPDEAVADVAQAPAVDPDAPAIERYGMAAENPDGKPTVAVVLIDDGSFAGAVPALAGIPFPVTVALNPSDPQAAEKMVAYRAAGIEVGILASLPEGAQPSDVEVFFEAAFAALPETVAVLDAGGAGLQSGNADLIEQTIAAVSEDGRGLITISQGLNATVRAAERVGVPTGTVYRDLDGEGQDARVIRRFMDQAAFRARQESGVVLIGRVRADTISALILWGTANRAGQVALVPVTTVFTEQ